MHPHHREMPGELGRVLAWFRDYKMPDGKPPNRFGYNDACLNREFALKVGVLREEGESSIRARRLGHGSSR